MPDVPSASSELMIEKMLLVHDVTLREVLEKLRPLLEPPPPPPKPETGSHAKEDAVLYRTGRKHNPARSRMT